MPDLMFNTPEKAMIARSKVIAYLNVKPETPETPEWAPIGIRVEDSSMAMDWQRETKKDILGSTFSTMKDPITTQNFDPWPLTNGDKAQALIWNRAIKDHDAQVLASEDMLIVHMYAGTENTAVFAERYSECAIEVTDFGGPGGGNIGMSTTITYGGTRTIGTAAVAAGVVTFTPDKK